MMLFFSSNKSMQNPEFVKAAFSAIAKRYVATNHVLSMGIDLLWRQRAVQRISEWKPKNILDLATGTGDLALAFQRAIPEVDILGSDFCPEMLEIAQQRGLRKMICADAMDLPFEDESFDVVTVAFGLRNMADYAGALNEMKRVLKPNGHLLVLDFSLPDNLLRAPYRFYLHKILPTIAGIMTGHKAAYDYLADSIESFPCGDDMIKLMDQCGYRFIDAEPLNGGIATIYTATK